MNNAIPGRIMDFLKDYPPFDLMQAVGLARLSELAIVEYHRAGDVLFKSGDSPAPYVYVVREGAVHLFSEEKEENVLIDTCDEGDLLGLRPMLADQTYMLTAIVQEETLLYAIPADALNQFMESEPKLALFMARSIAADTQRRYDQPGGGQLFLRKERRIDQDFELVEVQGMEHSRKPVTCKPELAVREAAEIMTRENVSSIVIVDENHRPVGILTDKDLRRRVATGEIALVQPVQDLMSSPVHTIFSDLTVADVQIEMIRRKIHHLVITEDGSDQTAAVGVITEHDLLVVQGNNPAVLIRRIRRAITAEDLANIRERAEQLLKKYIYQEVAISFISTVMTEINDALIRRVINLCLNRMDEEGHERPRACFCWLALGSEGRGEQLRRTDQDNALVFENVPDPQLGPTRTYYLQLASYVNDMLNDCGFVYCPADMMARNPEWCLSLSEWKDQFSAWIDEPDPQAVMHCSIFFDYRPVFGATFLAEALTEHIFKDIDKKGRFLSFLAKNAVLNPPPLSFFRSFVVEKSGEHKDAFDIKARAMMPLTDAARVLTLGAKLGKYNNTFRRFEKLSEIEPQNAELYQEAADAYEMLMRYRALKGLEQGDTGRYFRPDSLSKMERLNLRHCFQPIRKLQNLLMTRYKLAYLM